MATTAWCELPCKTCWLMPGSSLQSARTPASNSAPWAPTDAAFALCAITVRASTRLTPLGSSAHFSVFIPWKSFREQGIDLATVPPIIQRHGGKVWAKGAVNRGATVYCTLQSEHSIGGAEWNK